MYLFRLAKERAQDRDCKMEPSPVKKEREGDKEASKNGYHRQFLMNIERD